MIPHVLILGEKPRELRYDWESLCRLETEQKINALNPTVLQEISPTVLRALVWAGLLHAEPQLKIADVDKMLKGVRLTDLLESVVSAYTESIGLDSDEDETNDEEANED